MNIKVVYLISLVLFNFVHCWGMSLDAESGSFVVDYPLHHAAEQGDLKEVKRLAKKQSVNARDCKKNTPLHYARVQRIIRFLVDQEIHVNARNRDGKTALHFFVDDENEEAIEIVMECGAKTNIKDDDEVTVIDILDKKDQFAKHIENAEDREKRKKYLKKLRSKLESKKKKKLKRA